MENRDVKLMQADACNDKLLIEQLLNGEKQAFSQIINRYKHTVFGCAYSCLGNFHEAEEIAQETFVQAYMNLNKLQKYEKLSSWLCQIAKNQALNYANRKKAKVIPIDCEKMEQFRDPAASPEERLEEEEMKNAALALLHGLSQVLRDTMILYYVSGFSQADIANLLGVPLGTVKRRLYDAKKKIKEGLLPMVKETLQENRPSEDFDKRVQEALGKAMEAERGQQHKEASDYCDTALKLLDSMPESNQKAGLKRVH